MASSPGRAAYDGRQLSGVGERRWEDHRWHHGPDPDPRRVEVAMGNDAQAGEPQRVERCSGRAQRLSRQSSTNGWIRLRGHEDWGGA
eukprot:1801014-Pyramimonas_sp.AAC.2